MSLPVSKTRRPEGWDDWRWQLRQAIRTHERLAEVLALTEDERRGLEVTRGVFRFVVTPYTLSLLDRDDPSCPVRRQALPVAAEARVVPGERTDPLGEDGRRPVRAIVHKYPDRVLLLAVDHCPIYCRHCTRRRITSGAEGAVDQAALDEAVAYVADHPEVRDVLISGGDPLLLSDERLDELLGRLAAIEHVEMIRIGTRVPVMLPMRVTDALTGILRRHAPVYVVTHFNHVKECTDEAMAACERLVDAGVPVENQTVLLRGINDSVEAIKTLNHRLLRHRTRPYYLHLGDLAAGTDHLRVSVDEGLEILRGLRGHTTGLAVPHLAIDLPDGGGKVTVQPDYVVERRPGETVFETWSGERRRYPDPS